jgi:hypothetical protein
MLRSLRRDAARVESVLTQKRKTAQTASIPVESRANKK